MKLEKYVDKSKKKRKVILISLGVIVLISVSLLLYKTFASFTESAEFPIMNGKVDYFGNSDVYFAFYRGDEQLDTMPVEDNPEDLVFDHAECDNGASIVWNENEWAPLVKGLKKVKTKCSLYFKEYVPTLADKLVECGKSGINAAECISDNHGIDQSINESNFGKLVYAGENPANYISFNNELWRIIGVESVTDVNDNTEAHLKIIKSNDISNGNVGFSWDSSPIDINDGKGTEDSPFILEM